MEGDFLAASEGVVGVAWTLKTPKTKTSSACRHMIPNGMALKQMFSDPS